ncbi:MAG: vWA domain-containing protein [Candidatus Paceibacterota bacterium]
MITYFFKKVMEKDRGIALLIALVIVSVVTVVSATLAAVSFREVRISTGVSESMKAFYAQEAGTECARHWALKGNDYFRPGGESSIECNDESHSINTSSGLPSQSNFSFGYSDPSSEVEVEVTRNVVEGPIKDITIHSFGYNAPAGSARRSQWFRETDIYGICQETPDFMLTVDHSGSISSYYHNRYDGGIDCDADGDQKCELEIMRDAMNEFIARMMPNPSGNKVNMGRVVFGGSSKADLRKDLNDVKEQIPSSESKLNGNTPIGPAVTRTKDEFDDNGRVPASEYPDYMILLTDGAPNHSLPGEDAGSLDNLRESEEAIEEIKDVGVDVDVIVFAIGLNDNNSCTGYTEIDDAGNSTGYDVDDPENCGEWLDKVVAGDSSNTDHSTPAPFYYVPIDDFEGVSDAFGNIGTCVTPQVDK